MPRPSAVLLCFGCSDGPANIFWPANESGGGWAGPQGRETCPPRQSSCSLWGNGAFPYLPVRRVASFGVGSHDRRHN
jgi:hypothetical protein